MSRRWSDLSPSSQRLIMVAGTAEVALKIVALLDLRKRPASQIRGTKWVWTASMLVNSFGVVPLAYLVAGRRRQDGDA